MSKEEAIALAVDFLARDQIEFDRCGGAWLLERPDGLWWFVAFKVEDFEENREAYFEDLFFGVKVHASTREIVFIQGM